MKINKRKIGSVMLALALSSSVMGTAACNRVDDPNVLEIYVLHKGNGVQWCYDMIDAFKEQAWVKEKYPNLQIAPLTENDVDSFAAGQINAGEGKNRFDLLFTHMDGQSYAGPTGQFEDLTQSVYYSNVPGENIKYIDKHNASYTFVNRYIDVSDENNESYYQTSWNSGMDSIVYNETLLTALGKDVPNTTDEFIEICDYILDLESRPKGIYDKTFAIQQAKSRYWDYLFPVWWAQYQGVDGYLDFWNGIDNNRLSINVFDQQGREESLKLFEKILKYETGYVAKDSMSYEFMAGQTMFLKGNGVFHVNGDWFDNEMSEIVAQIKASGDAAANYKFKLMRLPIISALGTKLGITDDTLSAIVDYVDGETNTAPTFTSTEGYTNEEVINAVCEARSVVHSLGTKHAAIIPKYAKAKDIAIDFLRFMATDIAQEIYMKATGGSSLPFEYNVKEKNIKLYNSLTPFHQSRLDYFNADKFEIYTLPDDESFPLAQYGGLTATYNVQYWNTFHAEGNKVTAADIIEETKEFWDREKWETALASAGIAK